MALSLPRSWDEKRRQRRVHMEQVVGLAVKPARRILPLKRPQFKAHIHDVSSGGLRMEVVSDRPLPVGTTLKIWGQIDVGDVSRKVQLIGDVVWARHVEGSDEYLLGIQLRPRAKRSMQTWLQGVLEYIRKFDA